MGKVSVANRLSGKTGWTSVSRTAILSKMLGGSRLLSFTDEALNGITCTRASTATYINSQGLISTAAINTPRFDYNMSTLECNGLLRENEATNIALRSQEFSNATWTGQTNVTANTDTAPDGTLTADRHSATSEWNIAVYNVTGAAFVGTQVPFTPTSVWQRFSRTFTTPAGCTSVRVYNYRNNAGSIAQYQTITVTANTAYTFSFYAKVATSAAGTAYWGGQLELGASATSYIPTTTASATRSADSISLTTLPRAMNNRGGIKVRFKLAGLPTSSNVKVVQLDSGADTAITRVAVTADAEGVVRLETDTTSVGYNFITTGGSYDFTGSWDDTNIYCKLGQNEREDGVDTVANSFSALRLGSGVSGNGMNGWIENVQLYPRCQLDEQRTALTLPSAFSWFPYTISVGSDGRGVSSFNFRSAKPATTATYYVDPVNGLDANAGTSMAAALKNITTALAKGDVNEIVLAAGTYPRNRIPSARHTLARDLAIRVYGGGTANILGSDQDVLDWVADGTYPNVYTRVRSNVMQVRDANDLDANGEWTQLTLQTSVADVNANPGSYYVDGSNNLYVRTVDSRAPDNDLHVFLTGTFWTFQGQYTLWVDGTINLIGVSETQVRNTGLSTYVTYYERNVTSKYKVNSEDGIGVLGCDSYRVNGRVTDNLNDGYDYTALNGRANKAFELNCVGLRNGGSGAGNNNASTMHDNGSVIRLNGIGAECEGPIFADVDAGTTSLMINCSADETTDASAPRINYELSGTHWLVNCTSTNAPDYDVRVGGTVRYVGSQTLSSTITSGTITKVDNLSGLFS